MSKIETTMNIDEKLLRSIEILGTIVRYLLWEPSKNLHLSPIQIQFILFLRKKPKKFRKVTSLSSEFHLTPPTVSNAVNSLIRKGMVTRKNDPSDRRVYYLALTEKGEKIAEHLAEWNRSLKTMLSGMDYSTKMGFFRFFLCLVESLYREGRIKAVKICPICGHFVRMENRRRFRCLLTGKEMSLENLQIDCASYSPFSIEKTGGRNFKGVKC
jgi:DNA-binding MarR family transcriptional regulator